MKYRRRGFTLVEVLATLTVLGAVWVTIALALHSLFEAERKLSRGFESANAIDQLAQLLRSDSHQSGSVSLDETGDEPVLLLTSSPTRHVRFQEVEQGIERTVLVSDAIEHREVVYLPLEAVRWKIEERNQRQLILLQLTAREGRRPAREHEVKAAVGLVTVLPVEQEVEQP